MYPSRPRHTLTISRKPPKVIIQDWLPPPLCFVALCSHYRIGPISVMTMALYDFSPRKLGHEPTKHWQTVFNNYCLKVATVIGPDSVLTLLDLTA